MGIAEKDKVSTVKSLDKEELKANDWVRRIQLGSKGKVKQLKENMRKENVSMLVSWGRPAGAMGWNFGYEAQQELALLSQFLS